MKLLDQVRERVRVKHFSLRTEKAYVYWIERYIRFHGIRHPAEMGTAEVEEFLTHLAVAGRVAASTQNQALAALLFLYQHVLDIDIGQLNAVRAKRPVRVPLVLSRGEVTQLLDALDNLPTEEPYGILGRLMYGSGLRLLETCRLRTKDIDLERGQLTVREGKGDKDRFVMLPTTLRGRLAMQLEWRRASASGRPHWGGAIGRRLKAHASGSSMKVSARAKTHELRWPPMEACQISRG